MSFVFWLIVVVILLVAFGSAMRRYQMSVARRVLAEKLAESFLSRPVEDANRQMLADILKSWPEYKADKQMELRKHMADHQRLKGLDLSDESIRTNAYQALVGISAGKSPEK